MLGLLAALALAVSPGLTTAEAQARLVQAGPLTIVDGSQRDRPVYRLAFDASTAADLRPAGKSKMVGERRVWSRFAFSGNVYDEASAGTQRFTFTAKPTATGLAVDGLRGPSPSRYRPDLPLRAIFY